MPPIKRPARRIPEGTIKNMEAKRLAEKKAKTEKRLGRFVEKLGPPTFEQEEAINEFASKIMSRPGRFNRNNKNR